MRRRSFFHSIFFRMLIVFFVAVLPVYIVGIGIYQDGSTQMTQEILRTRIGQMEYYVQSLEDDLQRLTQMQSRCVSDTTINVIANRYNTLSNYEWGYQINAHVRELQSLKNISSYAYSVTTYYPRLGKKINTVSGLSDMNAIDEQINQAAEQNAPRLFWHNDQLYIATSLRASRENVAYSIVTLLSKAQLRDDLAKFGAGQEIEAALLFGDHALTETIGGYARAGQAEILSALAESRPQREDQRTLSEQLSEQSGSIVSGAADGEWADEPYAYAYTYSKALDITFISASPQRELYSATAVFERRLWQFTLAAALVIVVFSLLIWRSVTRPLNTLILAFEKLEQGDMTVNISRRMDDEFLYLYSKFNDMVYKLRIHIDQAYTQKMMRQQAELMQLQSQINPHFLYNSYFLLHRMIKAGDAENAQRFSRHMGEYFRYLTRNARQKVPLEEEAGHARIYADIQALRFEGRIEVFLEDVPEACRQLIVPRLILQPVLENAFEHGLKEKMDNGRVELHYKSIERGAIISIEDNGDDLTPERLRALNRMLIERGPDEITALTNIHVRLESMYGEGRGLAFFRSSLGGLRVEMTVMESEEHK